MNINIIKGTDNHINACKEALINSELGNHYFEREGSANKVIIEGIKAETLYVALEKDKCIGFIYYLPEGAFHSFAYLHLIAVKKEYRGKGVGKLLMNFFEDIAFKLNDKAFLVVADYNPKGKLYYEKLGYKQVGLITSLYREGINEQLMMKTDKK